jgi:hypothetical protein
MAVTFAAHAEGFSAKSKCGKQDEQNTNNPFAAFVPLGALRSNLRVAIRANAGIGKAYL